MTAVLLALLLAAPPDPLVGTARAADRAVAVATAPTATGTAPVTYTLAVAGGQARVVAPASPHGYLTRWALDGAPLGQTSGSNPLSLPPGGGRLTAVPRPLAPDGREVDGFAHADWLPGLAVAAPALVRLPSPLLSLQGPLAGDLVPDAANPDASRRVLAALKPTALFNGGWQWLPGPGDTAEIHVKANARLRADLVAAAKTAGVSALVLDCKALFDGPAGADWCAAGVGAAALADTLAGWTAERSAVAVLMTAGDEADVAWWNQPNDARRAAYARGLAAFVAAARTAGLPVSVPAKNPIPGVPDAGDYGFVQYHTGFGLGPLDPPYYTTGQVVGAAVQATAGLARPSVVLTHCGGSYLRGGTGYLYPRAGRDTVVALQRPESAFATVLSLLPRPNVAGVWVYGVGVPAGWQGVRAEPSTANTPAGQQGWKELRAAPFGLPGAGEEPPPCAADLFAAVGRAFALARELGPLLDQPADPPADADGWVVGRRAGPKGAVIVAVNTLSKPRPVPAVPWPTAGHKRRVEAWGGPVAGPLVPDGGVVIWTRESE